MSKPRIYFFCCPHGPAENSAYQHEIVGLAEGLHELGIPIYSNINYWASAPKADHFLFTHFPDVSPDDCDVVVLNSSWFSSGKKMPAQLFKRERKYLTVYIDLSDGVATYGFKPESRQFDLVLRGHYNRYAVGYPSNMRPWTFGPNNRIINAVADGITWRKRNKRLLSNFRVSHGIRAKAKERFYPLVEKVFKVDESNDGFAPPLDPLAYFEWERTGRRHNPNYYEKLKNSQAISCFGGYDSEKFLRPPALAKVSRAINKLLPEKFAVIHQWDSYRLWEAFSAGCLVMHVDFDKYGLQLPVMPKNLQHYIGVDFQDMKLVKEIIEDEKQLEKIANGGRNWMLEHYSPIKIAQRFMSTVGV